VQPTPVEPAAATSTATTDPSAVTTGGVVTQLPRKHKKHRKLAIADANPQTANTNTGSSGTTTGSGSGDEGSPADPGTGSGGTGGTPPLTPP
jgi:hypothetical protein